MKRKITCIGLATAMFALMMSYVYGFHELLEEDGDIVLTMVLGTMYCMGITGTALLGALFWILAFATGNTEETEEEAGV